MITVHHLDNSRSQRVLWLLEELELPYEIRPYRRSATMLAPPELKAIHPLGKSPVIEHDGHVVAETGAIIEYLLDVRDGGLRPERDTSAHRACTYWMYAAEGSMMTPLLFSLICQQIRKRSPFLIKPIASAIAGSIESSIVTDNLRTQIAFWEATLSSTPWFAGEFMSAADIMMSFPVETARIRDGLRGKTAVLEWLERIHERPAYKKALLKGGPYAYA